MYSLPNQTLQGNNTNFIDIGRVLQFSIVALQFYKIFSNY